MKSEQNDNKEYVVVYDLCDTKGEEVLKKMQKNDIPKNRIITEDQAKEKFDYNKSNAKVDGEEPEYYYIDLYNNKLFAKVPSNKCSYHPCYGFTVKTDEQMVRGLNMSYEVKTGKDLVKNSKNSKNIDGIMLNVSGIIPQLVGVSIPQLFFNKEEERFSYYTDVSVYNGLEYQISLEKFLSDNNPSFNLFRSSYWHNLCHTGEHESRRDKAGSFARLFGVANDGHNHCCLGCFSCGKVIVDDDNDYVVNNDYEYQAKYKATLSLNDVSRRIGINQTTK